MYMLQKVRLALCLTILFTGLSTLVIGQNSMPIVIQKTITEIEHDLRVGDTIKAIQLYKNLLKADSIDSWRCKILLELATLEFLENDNNYSYRLTMNEADKYGCDKKAILEKYKFIFVKMKLKGHLNYGDSLITLYTKLISLRPDYGVYYFSRFLEKISANKDSISAENDLQMAVKKGDKVAIWYLKRREKEAKNTSKSTFNE